MQFFMRKNNSNWGISFPGFEVKKSNGNYLTNWKEGWWIFKINLFFGLNHPMDSMHDLASILSWEKNL